LEKIMEKTNFRRSFVGYRPASVKKLLHNLETDYKNKLIDLRKQMAEEVREHEQIRAEIKKVRDEMESYKKLEEKISRQLLDAHMKAVKKVFSAMRSVEGSEQEMAGKIQARKSELAQLRTTMEKIRQEILSIAEQYKPLFDRGKGDLSDAGDKQFSDWL